jgi:prepilin-type N-terminal cleavage/methylation domain-containing protein
MFTNDSAQGVRERRRGFTMVELIAVLAMLAVLAAAAIPSIAGFIEHGKHINRTNIARTLYLATQSELVKMRTEGGMGELTGGYFQETNAETGARELIVTANAAADKRVWKILETGGADSFSLPAGEGDNVDSVRYISKPRGSFTTDGDTELAAFCRLLDRVVLDKSILNNAILMEYNVETGVVLSVFYGDTEAFEDGREFVYDTSLAGTDDKIYTITGNRGYEFAEQRRQGYYGANGTGDLLPPPDMMPQTEIFDGAFKPIPALVGSDGFTSSISGMENVLYVEAYLPTGADLANYNLTLETPDGTKIVENADLGVLNLSPGRVHGPFAVSRPIVQHGIARTAEFEQYIIILDHVSGQDDSLGIDKLAVTTPELIKPHTLHARVTEGGWGERSTTFAHTLFFGDMNGGFEVTSARHLYNIRHNLGGNYYQTQDIDMKPTIPDPDDHENFPPEEILDPANIIANFTPIGTAAEPFLGTYDAYQPGTDDEGNASVGSFAIRDLTITQPGDDIGLFGVIQPSAPATDTTPAVGGLVQYLNLDNVEISGAENVGAVAGQGSGTIVVVSVSGTVNGTADDTGGLVGQNSGTIAMSGSSAAVTGVNDVGGLVGDNSGTLVTPTVTGIAVTGTGTNVGGVAGSTSTPIANATVTHTTVTGEEYVGGVVGLTNSAVTTAAVTDVTVTARTSLAGGVAGQADGENAKITGATVTGATVQALRAGDQGGDQVGGVAGWTEAAISNATVSGSAIDAMGEMVGGIVGQAAATAKLDSVTVSDTTVRGSRILVGGVAGLTEGPITTAQVRNATVVGDGDGTKTPDGINTFASSFVGGIAGRSTAAIGDSDANDVVVYNVEVSGFADNIGGVVGRINGANIQNAAVSEATITGTSQIGGVAGETSASVSITNATVSKTTVQNLVGDAPSGNAVGGIAGENNGTIATVTVADSTVAGRYMVGGVAGLSSNAITDADVTNTGVTSRSSNAGGIAGEVNHAAGVIQNATVLGGATGSAVTGSGNYIGGAVGKTSANMTNVTVSGMSVASTGGASVGGILGGTNTGATATVSNVLAVETKVAGPANNVGGIVGFIDGATGVLQNATYLSAANDAQITGTVATGGIVGHNLGTISDVLFLALAPKVGDAITPITANDAGVSNAYYLRGKEIRPDPVADARNGYNLEEAVGPGAGQSTWALYSMFNDGYELGNQTTPDWAKLPGLTQDQAISLINTTYPYPYTVNPGVTVLPANPGWPIAEEDVAFGGDGYYYELDTAGNYYGGATPLLGDDTDDSPTLTAAGYVVFSDVDIANATVSVRPAGTDGDWTALPAKLPAAAPPALVTALRGGTATADTKAYILPLQGIVDAVGGSAIPLELKYKTATGPETLIGNYIHPLFANAVFDTNTKAPTAFRIRTPWQLQNIKKLSEGNSTAGKTFLLDRTLDFGKYQISINDGNYGMYTNWPGVASVSGQPINYAVVWGANALFAGTFDGNGKEIRKLSYGKGLFERIGPDATIQNLTVTDHHSEATGQWVSSIVQYNAGTIQGCKITRSVYSLNTSDTGFIASQNSGTITDCVVENSEISAGYDNIGAVAGSNTGTIQKTGVINAVLVGASGGSTNTVGGIAGVNKDGGNLQDVFFLSTITPKQIADGTKKPPVDNRGGGIVGQNSATVLRALYLAPAPVSGSASYPIVRSGAAAATVNNEATCFYLFGGSYRIMPGSGEWITGDYNLRPAVGGGQKMDTEDLDLVNLETGIPPIQLGLYGWTSVSGGSPRYPYPLFDAANPPASWPETEGSFRPKQAVGDWKDAKVQPMKPLNFLNGDFGDPYLPGKPNNAGIPANDPSLSGGNLNSVITYMTNINGWNTRPANPEDYRWGFERKYSIEQALPRGDFMWRDYKGNSAIGNLLQSPDDSTYVELNAYIPGMLYQVADTEPGQEFYYSFHHATRLYPSSVSNASDAMNFYLSPTGSRIDPVYNNIADEDKLQLIRPVESPRDSIPPPGYLGSRYVTRAYAPSGSWANGAYPADLADGSPITVWTAKSKDEAVYFQWGGTANRVLRYEMTRQSSGQELAGDPNAWIFEGSNDDGKTWTVLDQRGSSINEWHRELTNETTSFRVNNPGEYKLYRFRFMGMYLEKSWPVSPVLPTLAGLKVYVASTNSYNGALNFPVDAVGGDPNLVAPYEGYETFSPYSGYNYAAWRTVKYGPDKTAGMEKYWKTQFPNFPDSGVYLYDVWIGDLATGYGLTFWSKGDFSISRLMQPGSLWWYGIDDTFILQESLGAYGADAVNNVIGYWDVDHGWKQYYGRYFVPEGQTKTEFAWKSTIEDTPDIGNFLDGAVFKPAAVLGVNETIYAQGDSAKTPVTTVDPGDRLTVEITVTPHGGPAVLEAKNVELTNHFGDFSQYFKFAENVKVDGASSSAYNLVTDYMGNSEFTMPLSVTPGTPKIVTFDIEILGDIYGTAKPDYPTLFYYIQNQTRLDYTSFELDKQVGQRVTTYSPVNQTINISKINMTKTVAVVDAAGTVLTASGAHPVGKTGSIFQVDLNLKGQLPVTGIVNDTLPECFTLNKTSIQKLDGTALVEGVDYILYGADTPTPRLAFRNVNFAGGTEETYGFRYQMTYTGDRFGVTHAGLEAYYRFRYESTAANGVVSADVIQLPFTEPKLGVRATAANEKFIVPDEGGTIPNLVEHSNINRADLPYAGVSFLPEIVFYTDAGGTTPLPVTKFEGDTLISAANYTARLMSDNSLSFAPRDARNPIPPGEYKLYYKIVAKDTASGFDLSSEGVGTITVTVDAAATEVSSVQTAQPAPPAPAPDAPNPAPPVVAALLGLLGAAQGGGLTLKNGISAAVSALLGAVSLLLVLCGLVLLPEKKNRSKR